MRYSITTVLCCCGAALTAGGFVTSALSAKRKPNAGHLKAQSTTIQDIRNYRKWALVNPKPYFVSNPQAALCAAARSGTIISPHDGWFIKVYVNDVGRQAMLAQDMLTQERPKFPVGSIIVKAKLAGAKATQPELMTVMLKHAPGYDPQHGDWEYMVVNGPATTVEARGKLANCQSCHTDKSKDYIFRTYLTDIHSSARNSD